MTPSELIHLSLEQCAEVMGDPTGAVFARMYETFPALTHFRSDDSSWEHYMMQEIITNILQFADDPDSALLTIRDMTAHHQLIGVPVDVFKGMYATLLDVVSPSFQGEQRDDMLTLWHQTVGTIHQAIDQQASY